MILFFPDIHEDLDFQEVRFLQQELLTDVTEGEIHRVDLLVETKLKGQNSIVIIHMEPQASYLIYSQNFNDSLQTPI